MNGTPTCLGTQLARSGSWVKRFSLVAQEVGSPRRSSGPAETARGRSRRSRDTDWAHVGPRTVPRDTDLAEATANRVKSLDDDALLADLNALAATAGGAVEIADLSAEPCLP